MAKHVLAFDCDKTLLDHIGDINLGKVESVRTGCIPIRAVCERVKDLVVAGHEVHVISARGDTLRRVTKEQLRNWVHPDLTKRERLHLQAYWTDYEAGRRWKAQVLKDIGAAVYVGDHIMDELAAQDAGIPFMHVDEYRKGASILELAGDLPEDLVRLEDAAVQQVVPRNSVPGALRRPEEARLARVARPGAAGREVERGAVASVVGKNKPIHAAAGPAKRKSRTRGEGGR